VTTGRQSFVPFPAEIPGSAPAAGTGGGGITLTGFASASNAAIPSGTEGSLVGGAKTVTVGAGQKIMLLGTIGSAVSSGGLAQGTLSIVVDGVTETLNGFPIPATGSASQSASTCWETGALAAGPHTIDLQGISGTNGATCNVQFRWEVTST